MAAHLPAPFLKQATLRAERVAAGAFPFDRLAFLRDPEFALRFERPIAMFVGENGSGKSTLLEAIARQCGFHPSGGSRNQQLYRGVGPDESGLAAALRLSWLPKVANGFFFRSETFASLGDHIDDLERDAPAPFAAYGGRPMHEQSHGESFLALFANRLGADRRAIYLLDEPETALSPTRQLAFLRVIREWERSGNVQAIIATHSPILMSYPGAALLQFTAEGVAPAALEEIEHFRVTRSFLADPRRSLDRLFED